MSRVNLSEAAINSTMHAMGEADGAFPYGVDVRHGSLISHGISKRDYFAAKAMQAICNADAEKGAEGFGYSSPEQIVGRAYRMADAMLAERAK